MSPDPVRVFFQMDASVCGDPVVFLTRSALEARTDDEDEQKMMDGGWV